MNWNNIATKGKIMLADQCQRACYLRINNPELRTPISESQQAIIDKGVEIGILARQLFPGGIDLSQGNKVFGADLLHDTRLALSKENAVLYEAAFLSKGGIYCQADVIVKNGNHIDLYEVKSGTSRKPEYITDAVIQHHTITKFGYTVTPHLVYINRDYIRGQELDLNELFIIDDVALDVEDEHANLMSSIIKFRQIQKVKTAPAAIVGEKCFKPMECPFKEACWSEHVPENSVFTIGGIRKKKAEELFHSGIKQIADILPKHKLSPAQMIQVRAVQTGIPYINREFIKFREPYYDLSKLHYFMDFESVMYTPPRFIEAQAYDHTCFQFSIIKGTYGNYERIEYLAKPGTDCRFEFITKLIKAIGTEGNIYVYNLAFEKTRLLESGEFFNMQEILAPILLRLVDVMEFFRKNYIYFPEQNGSYSLKTILPILVPAMSYKDLVINNGSKAMAAYEKMGDLSLEEQAVVRQQLLDYCFMDVACLPEIIKAIYKL